jgi:hypothetical protein
MQLFWTNPLPGIYVCNGGPPALVSALASGGFVGKIWDNEDGKASELCFDTLAQAKEVIEGRLARSASSART